VDCGSWCLTGESLRLSPLSDAQQQVILQLTELAGKPVTVSRPWCVDRLQKAAQKSAANAAQAATMANCIVGIAFGLPLDASDDDLVSDNNAACMVRSFPVKQSTNTKTVLFAFKPYVPRPMRCTNFGAFGHLASSCKNTIICDHCSAKGHSLEHCSAANDATKARCVNCRGRHRTSDKTCPRYITNRQILEFAHKSTPPLPFREAQAKWVEAQKASKNKAEPAEHGGQTAPPTDAISITYAQAVRSKKRERSQRQSAASSEPTPAISNQVSFDKGDLEAIITNALALNLVACSVLQSEPATEAKQKANGILQKLQQSLIDLLERHGVQLQAVRDTYDQVANLLAGDEDDMSSVEPDESLDSTVVSAESRSRAGPNRHESSETSVKQFHSSAVKADCSSHSSSTAVKYSLTHGRNRSNSQINTNNVTDSARQETSNSRTVIRKLKLKSNAPLRSDSQVAKSINTVSAHDEAAEATATCRSDPSPVFDTRSPSTASAAQLDANAQTFAPLYPIHPSGSINFRLAAPPIGGSITADQAPQLPPITHDIVRTAALLMPPNIGALITNETTHTYQIFTSQELTDTQRLAYFKSLHEKSGVLFVDTVNPSQRYYIYVKREQFETVITFLRAL
jgi:hypothetical protein